MGNENVGRQDVKDEIKDILLSALIEFVVLQGIPLAAKLIVAGGEELLNLVRNRGDDVISISLRIFKGIRDCHPDWPIEKCKEWSKDAIKVYLESHGMRADDEELNSLVTKVQEKITEL